MGKHKLPISDDGLRALMVYHLEMRRLHKQQFAGACPKCGLEHTQLRAMYKSIIVQRARTAKKRAAK